MRCLQDPVSVLFVGEKEVPKNLSLLRVPDSCREYLFGVSVSLDCSEPGTNFDLTGTRKVNTLDYLKVNKRILGTITQR